MSKIKALKKEAQVALPNSGETYIAEDGTVSMVLDDTHDDAYEPSEQEIKEYAEWLGMQLPEDHELMWIAREGLRAPLPKEWKPCKTDAGEVYYFNFKTGDSIWDHPMDEHFKSKFKTEKDRLRKSKENGGKMEDVLSKLPQRNNIIFSQSGVTVHDSAGDSQKQSSSGPGPAASATGRPAPLSKAAASSPVTASPLSAMSNTPTSTSAAGKNSSSNYSTAPAAVKEEPLVAPRGSASKAISLSDSSPAPSASIVQHSQSPAPAPALAEQPKLVSEAEKILQDRVRLECETEHKQLVEKLEREFTDATTSVRQTHDQTIADLKKQLTQTKKSQQTKLENQLQDELEAQQKGVETRTKRDVQRLEEDIDRIRDKIRDVQTSALQRMEKEAESIESSVRDGVQTKVREIEEEIASIRVRHAKAQQDLVEQERSRLQIDLGRAIEHVRQTSQNDFEVKAQGLRQQHAQSVQALRESHAQAMAEESRRAESARGGEQESVARDLRQRQVEECAAISAQSATEQQRLTQEEEAKLQQYRHQLSTELALVFRQGSQSSSSAAVVAVDNEIEEQLRQTLESLSNERRRRIDELAASRARQLAEVAAAGPSDSSQLDASALESRLQREFAAERHALEGRLASELDSLRLSLASELRTQQNGTKAAAVTSAVDRELNMFIAKTTDERRSEERAYEASKVEIAQHNATVHQADDEKRRSFASAAAAAASAKPAAVAAPQATTIINRVAATSAQVEAAAVPAVREAIEKLRRSFDDDLAAAMRQLREEAAQERSRMTIELAEELANVEHLERRKIDVELQAEASFQTTPAATGPPSAVEIEMRRQQRALLQQEMVQKAMSETDAEFADRLASMRRDFQARIAAAASRQPLQHHDHAPLRTDTPSLVMSSRTANGASSAPLQRTASSGTDPLRFLEDQQRELAQRQQALAHARSEWAANEGGGQGGPSTGYGQEQDARRDVASLGAIRKYYDATAQVGRGAGHVDPGATFPQPHTRGGEASEPQLVHVLSKLSDKLDSLTAKVSALENPNHHHQRGTHQQNPTSEAALNDKWSNILRQLNRGSRKTADYADAVRQYCVGD